eukprot:INCI5106.1.p1 GENE.INCI5106.1~~INCI5106.1.p1  ORF type:complete len:541 (-),score=63.93 INCI5106.1:109-1731(-)
MRGYPRMGAVEATAMALLTIQTSVVLLQVNAKEITWSNVVPRHNVTGDVMDAHDGTYNQWGGPGTPWYYYAMGYGLCEQGQDMCHECGYGYSWIGVWKSDDLSDGSWELLGEAREADGSWPQQSEVSAYFRVHVVYNAKTAKYVLWVNVDDCPDKSAGGACYAVGTSSTPEGPFAYVGTSTARFPSAGDFDILVDDDAHASGYLIYTSTSTGHVMSVEKLTDDYLKTVADGPPAPEPALPGYKLVGDGGCRDSSGLEPSFFTDEASDSLEASMKGNESACAEACTDVSACTAFAWCDGDAAGAACNGACHLYVPDSSISPADTRWEFLSQRGNASDVSHVPAGETWWRCQVKSPGQHLKSDKPQIAYDPLGPTNTSSGVIGNHFVEAPAIFKRQGIYYALFGECCCFCGHGSGIGVYTASAPLGPWTYHENIGCAHSGKNFEPQPGCGCGMNGGSPPELHCPAEYGSSVTKAQQNFVIQVHTPSGLEYIWTGDMWQSSADGIKAHDLQFWTPLTFVNDSITGIRIPQLVTWVDNFTIDVL